MSLLGDLPALARSIGPIAVKAIASGRIFKPRCVLTEPDPDILCEYDVEIPLSDETKVTANVFRSKRAAARNERVPIIMCAHPYDNRLIPALGRTPLGGAPQQYRLIPPGRSPGLLDAHELGITRSQLLGASGLRRRQHEHARIRQ
jgi:hypothetical protein